MSALPQSLSQSYGIRDTRLIAKAIKQRWPIPEQYREAIINQQVLIASGLVEGVSAREQTQAFNALVAADSQNVADEPQEHHHTHDLGPVTEANLESQRAKRFADLARRM